MISGADYSFIPLEIAEALRLDIDQTETKILTVAGITKVFQTKVYVEIPRKGKLPVDVGVITVHVMPHNVGYRVPMYF